MQTNDFQDHAVETYDVSLIADVHLIQILGEQLIGSEKVGILELIKNSYDAGATECHVWIEKVPGLPDVPLSDPEIANLPGPVITISDNGCGMDENTIRNGWLRPATRIKTSVKERLKLERKKADERGARSEYEILVDTLRREHGGRLPLGEKGVGRFATHRLGQHLLLRTKIADEPCEWMLQIDWNRFDAPDDDPVKTPTDLNAVKLNLVKQPPTWDYGATESGTVLRIYGGRAGFEWSQEKLIAIGRAIKLLRSPSKNRAPTGFDMQYHIPQISEKIELPTDTVPAPFECTALVDEKGHAEIEVYFVPPPSLSKPIPKQTWVESGVELRRSPQDDAKYWDLSPDDDKPRNNEKSKLRVPECGPFMVDLKVWIRDNEWIESADRPGFRKYLDEFGGIGVYRDGLSILPAQIASKDDWLRLSTRHIQKGSNISYYQMWGSVDLTQELNPDLIDRTSREGLLETKAFSDLGQLVRMIVFTIEHYVQTIRADYNLLKQGERIPRATLNKQARVASEVLNMVAKGYDFSADPLGIKKVIGKTDTPEQTVSNVVSTIEYLRRETEELQQRADALLEAAGYGIAIAVAIHEIEKVTSNLYFGLDRLSKDTLLNEVLHPQVNGLRENSESLLNELRRLAPLRVTRMEKRVKFGVRSCILAAMGAFRITWNDMDLHFLNSPKSSDFEMQGSFGACSQVFANLFDNATYWLRTVEAQNRRIVVQMDPENRKVVIADSGPGIAESIRPHLFQLFFSLKNPPSGLGLYICSYYMRQMKGNIRESHESERIPGLPGAHFTLIFPKQEQD